MIRKDIKKFQEIPNIGPAMQRDFEILGLVEPQDLAGLDPYEMYDDLCRLTEKRHDPCVLDVFIAAVRYMEGAPARDWWYYTAERKKKMGS